MNSTGQVTPEMEVVLKRYLQIQLEEHKLKEEKAVLQSALADHLAKLQTELWHPVMNGMQLKVTSKTAVTIEYDEPKLRERLGDRYLAILEPDLKKIRYNLKQVEPALVQFLDVIGSPTPDKIRESIEKGQTSKEEYAGAFERAVKHRVSVANMTTAAASHSCSSS